jgi:serine/threonine protein kinase
MVISPLERAMRPVAYRRHHDDDVAHEVDLGGTSMQELPFDSSARMHDPLYSGAPTVNPLMAPLLAWNQRSHKDLAWHLAIEIGSGSFGRVFRLKCKGLGTVAAKRFEVVTLEERREKMKQLEREARVLAAVHHPNIVQVTISSKYIRT